MVVKIQRLSVSISKQDDRASVTNSLSNPQSPYSYREKAHHSSVPEPTVKASAVAPEPQKTR